MEKHPVPVLDSREEPFFSLMIDAARMAHWVRAEGGISGDRWGYLLDGVTLFSFPAPQGLADEGNVPVWDLYSFAVENASEKILVEEPPPGSGKTPQLFTERIVQYQPRNPSTP